MGLGLSKGGKVNAGGWGGVVKAKVGGGSEVDE